MVLVFEATVDSDALTAVNSVVNVTARNGINSPSVSRRVSVSVFGVAPSAVPVALAGYNIALAAVGLAVNVVCAIILGRAHDDAGGGHAHGAVEGPHHHDLNLKSAYLHVMADALTSALANALRRSGAAVPQRRGPGTQGWSSGLS